MKKRSPYAWIWLGAWLGIVIFMSIFSAFFAVTAVSPKPPSSLGWSGEYYALCCELALLILSAPLIILLDNGQGRGLKNVYRTAVRSQISLDDGAVSGMLSVLSIRAAITFGVLVALVTWQGKTGDSPLVSLPIAWKSLSKSPLALIFATIIVVLGLSIITTLAASLCYEYSIKVDWRFKSKVKLQLRQKGHWFGVIGFYCLMWSLAAITALVNPDVCMAAIAVIFFIMWWFYFFSTDVLEVPKVTTQAAESVTSTSATLKGMVEGNAKEAFFEWGTSTEYDERVLADATSRSPSAILNGLRPNTTYHFRLVAGTLKGADLTFTTPH